MSTLEPKTRTEQFYDAILSGDTSELPTPATREEVYLRQIAENGSGGGSSLPEVTAEDNGKVLKVVDGAWDKAESNTIIIRGHQQSDNKRISWADGLLTSDICNLCKSGKNVIVVVYFSETDDTAKKFFRPMYYTNKKYQFTSVSRINGISTRYESFELGDSTSTSVSPNVKIIQDPTE